MHIHPIRTGSVAVRERQRHGTGRGPARVIATLLDRTWTDPLPILAWVIEHDEGLIVVDTGETAAAAEDGYFTPWHPYFRLGLREWVRPEQEIGPQLRALGFDVRDVRHVVLTHLHTDHAGGIVHFPTAAFAASRAEIDHASGLRGKLRGYLPQHWPRWFDPRPVDFDGPPFGPFASSEPLTEAGDVVLLPTPGHTPGHLSVAVRSDDRVIFIAGDASYTERLMLDGIADGVAPDAKRARETLARIRQLTLSQPTLYLPSHDPESVTRMAQAWRSGAARGLRT